MPDRASDGRERADQAAATRRRPSSAPAGRAPMRSGRRRSRRARGGAVAHHDARGGRARADGASALARRPGRRVDHLLDGRDADDHVGLVAAAVGDGAHHAGDAVGAGHVDRAAAHALGDAAGLRRSAAPRRGRGSAMPPGPSAARWTSITVTGKRHDVGAAHHRAGLADHARRHLRQRQDRVGGGGGAGGARASPAGAAARGAGRARRLIGAAVAAGGVASVTVNHVSRSPSSRAHRRPREVGLAARARS